MNKPISIKFLKILLTLQVLVLTALGSAVWLKTYCPVFYVTSDSMDPNIPKGSLIVISNRWLEFKDLEGEPVVFFEPLRRRVVVHRALRAEQGYLVTRGDNNAFVDSYRVAQENVLGRVVLQFSSFGQVGWLALILLGLVLFLGLLLK